MTPENGIEWTSFQEFPVIRVDPGLHPRSLGEGYFLFMAEQKTWIYLSSWLNPVFLSKQLVDVNTHIVLINQHGEVWIYTHIHGLPR